MCRKVLIATLTTMAFLSFGIKTWASGVSCSKKQRELQDCKLQLDKFPVHIWKDKIILRGPVEREMISMKLAGFAEWDAVNGQALGGRHFLEVILWSQPVGEAEVASAVSYLYEIKPGQIDKRLERTIQKRKVKSGGGYEYDKRSPVKLKLQSGRVHWLSGKESGVL